MKALPVRLTNESSASRRENPITSYEYRKFEENHPVQKKGFPFDCAVIDIFLDKNGVKKMRSVSFINTESYSDAGKLLDDIV